MIKPDPDPDMRLLLTIILFSFTTLCTSGSADSETEEKHEDIVTEDIYNIITPAIIRQHEKLRVCINAAAEYPYQYEKNNGQKAGLEFDLLTDMATQLEVELEFLSCDNRGQTITERLNSGQADIALGMFPIRLKTARSISFSKPYLYLGHGLLINRRLLAQKRIHDKTCLTDCREITIGHLHDDLYPDFISRRMPQARLRAYQSWNELVNDVTNGSLFALFADEVFMRNLIQERPELGLNLKYILLPDVTEQLGITLSWKNRHLLSWLNQFLTDKFEPLYSNQLFVKYTR